MWWSIASSSSPCVYARALSSIINVQLCHSEESRIAQYWCEFPEAPHRLPPTAKMSSAASSSQLPTRHSHTTSWRNPGGYVIQAGPVVGATTRKTLTTLNFAMMIRERKKNTEEQQCCQPWAKNENTNLRVSACVCVRAEQISVSFISLSFIMISPRWQRWLRTWTWTRRWRRGGEFYY